MTFAAPTASPTLTHLALRLIADGHEPNPALNGHLIATLGAALRLAADPVQATARSTVAPEAISVALALRAQSELRRKAESAVGGAAIDPVEASAMLRLLDTAMPAPAS